MAIVSLSFATLHVVPMVNRDRILLRGIYEVDVQGISLEGDLQSQVQESHSKFLRLLNSRASPEDIHAQIQALRQDDHDISITSERVRLLGESQEYWQHFATAWEQYATNRDDQLALVLRGDGAQAQKLNQTAGEPSFEQVQKAIQVAKAAFQRASASHLLQASDAVNGAMQELLAVLFAAVASVAAILWMDWNRTRIEKNLQRTKHDLLASENRFRQAYESAAVGMTLVNLDFTILSINAAAARILGYGVNELIGKPVSLFMPPEEVQEYRAAMASLHNVSGISYQRERRVQRRDGTFVWLRNSVTLLKPAQGEPHYFAISEEITKQKEANDRLRFLANYDSVTKLPNLHSFEEQLALALDPDSTGSAGVALLYMEIDGFDFLKGTFGRTAVDEILSEVATRLADLRQPNELMARIDDSVFACMLLSDTFKVDAISRAAELRNVFHLAGESVKQHILLAPSIGVAFANGFHDDPADLLKFARAAMLEARSQGGDFIQVADPALQLLAAERHRIESALLTGLHENEFRVVFQPQFAVATGRLVRFEALCRWTSAELGPISPDRFIPIAEQSGFILEIGNRVMRQALDEAKTWVDSGRSIGVGVNISPLQFMRPGFTQTLEQALIQSEFPPELLQLEITEGIFIRDLNLAVARILELQSLGVSIALDDFGSGYSSLSYLKRMPINAVKLDRSFVTGLNADTPDDLATVSLLRSVISMARALNLRVITEGVETEQQLEILRDLGCDEAQGYLLGRPESAAMAYERVLQSPLNKPESSVA